MKPARTRIETFLSLVAAAVAGIQIDAADLTLVGDSAAVWNTTAANKPWTNSVGTAVAFAQGDNVLVSSEHFTGPSLMMDMRVKPGDVVFDIAETKTLKFGWSTVECGLHKDVKSFRKQGAGTLLFADDLSGSHKSSGDSSKCNVMTCGVDVVEGQLALKDPNVHNFLGPRNIPHWAYVRDGAALSFLERNQTGTFSSPQCGICIQLDKGGRLNHATNAVSSQINTILCLNTLRLNGGDIVNGAKAHYKDDDRAGGDCAFKIFNRLWFSGDTPHAFGFNEGEFDGFKTYTPSGTLKGYKVSLNPYNPVEFRVDEIAEGVDAYVNMMSFTWGTNTVGQFRSDIIKTGDGTLCFPSNNCARTFYGDFTVKEGSVVFKSLSTDQNFFEAAAGYPQQTITVSTGATLRVERRNITLPGGATTPNIKFVVDHGTLEFVPSDNGWHGSIAARDWVFDDATLDIRNKGLNERFGIFVFKNSVTFKGTKPLVMMPDASLDTKNQAVSVFNGYRTMDGGMSDGDVTVFDVEDMTLDGSTDVVMGYHIWNGCTNDTAVGVQTDSGFTKTGAGTFSVASMTNKVSGVVTVAQGTLRIDGKLVTPAAVNIASGAFIGGTGTVARVSMAAGSGFDAPAGQDSPLTVEGDLALPATGVVNISNLDGLAGDDLPAARLAAATGAVTGVENLANWTVSVDGTPAPNWEIVFAGGVVQAKRHKGLAVIIR